MKIVLFSREKVRVEGQAFKAEISLKNSLELEEGDFVKVFPEGARVFCFHAGQSSKFVKNIIFKNYILSEIVDFPRVFDGRFFVAKTISGGTTNVLGAPFKWNVNKGKKTFSLSLPDLENIELFENKNALILRAESAGKDFISCFHKASETFKSFFGTSEFDDKTLQVLVPSGTLSGHGQILTFDLTRGVLEPVQKDPVYLGSRPREVPPFLTHIAFFEAVKEKDFVLAKTFLCEDLAKKLGAEALSEFFGEFDAIKTIKGHNNKSFIAIIKNQSENVGIARVFSLEFSGGKISDIQEED